MVTADHVGPQVISHGRHPAEWDRIALTWVEDAAPAVPYFPLLEACPKPTRARETVCELLAAGLPLHPLAHVLGLNNVICRKAFVRLAKRLIAVVRVPAAMAVHVAAAAETGALQREHAEFVGAAQAAIAQAQGDRSAALACVVRWPPAQHISGVPVCCLLALLPIKEC